MPLAFPFTCFWYKFLFCCFFLKLLNENLSFYQKELEKLMNGLDMDGDSTELTDHIRSYLIKVKGEEAHEKSSEKQEDTQENEQQFFYISGIAGFAISSYNIIAAFALIV